MQAWKKKKKYDTLLTVTSRGYEPTTQCNAMHKIKSDMLPLEYSPGLTRQPLVQCSIYCMVQCSLYCMVQCSLYCTMMNAFIWNHSKNRVWKVASKFLNSLHHHNQSLSPLSGYRPLTSNFHLSLSSAICGSSFQVCPILFTWRNAIVSQDMKVVSTCSCFCKRFAFTGGVVSPWTQPQRGRPGGSVQSINQSNFYSTNIPGEARLSGTTAKSVFNSKIDQAVP